MSARTILISVPDMNELRHLLDLRRNSPALDRQHLEMLAKELDRAEVVSSDAIPPDVVTMHSRVRYRNLDTGEQVTYTLVFPAEADISANKISVLAPIGTALLGYREGDVIEWPVPGGLKRLKVLEVSHPSAAAEDEPGLAVARRGPAGVPLRRVRPKLTRTAMLLVEK